MTTGRTRFFSIATVLVMAMGVKGQKINGHAYVDLGLSVVWATCNVGASSPEDTGDYYGWGATGEGSWDNDNCKHYSRSISDIGGTSSDVAHLKWGGTWRMPSASDFWELINNCSWTFTTINGVDGYNVKGKNGKSIFLPAAGSFEIAKLYNYCERGFYWSSSPDGTNKESAKLLYFSYEKEYYVESNERSLGYSVRPVADKTR